VLNVASPLFAKIMTLKAVNNPLIKRVKKNAKNRVVKQMQAKISLYSRLIWAVRLVFDVLASHKQFF
jgi:hypothetical protein